MLLAGSGYLCTQKKTARTLVPRLLICNGEEHLVSHIMTHWEKRKLKSSNFSAFFLIGDYSAFGHVLLSISIPPAFLYSHTFEEWNIKVTVPQMLNTLLMISWLVLMTSMCIKNPFSMTTRCFAYIIDFEEVLSSSSWNVWSIWKCKGKPKYQSWLFQHKLIPWNNFECFTVAFSSGPLWAIEICICIILLLFMT